MKGGGLSWISLANNFDRHHPLRDFDNALHSISFCSTTLTKGKTTNNKNDSNPNMMLSVVEKAIIGGCAGGIAGAFTYVCLHPLDTVKTKLQTRGASQLYKGALDVITKVVQKEGMAGLYSGVSAVLVGSAISSAIYFGTCEFGKAILFKYRSIIPSLAIPPAAGAMGNLVSSAVMVPKELITQRMQVPNNHFEYLNRILHLLWKPFILLLLACHPCLSSAVENRLLEENDERNIGKGFLEWVEALKYLAEGFSNPHLILLSEIKV